MRKASPIANHGRTDLSSSRRGEARVAIPIPATSQRPLSLLRRASPQKIPTMIQYFRFSGSRAWSQASTADAQRAMSIPFIE